TNSNNSFSQLYYCFSADGGLTWSSNYAVSPPFNHMIGFPGTPPQQKIGDYLGMVSLDSGPCIAYSATFNGEEDVYFLRVQMPINLSASRTGDSVHLSWTALPAARYCVEFKDSLETSWSTAATLGCTVATNTLAHLEDTLASGAGQR